MLGTLLRRTLVPASIVIGLAACSAPAVDGTRVKIANGTIVGIEDAEKGVRIFKGIPYARPPVGELRWREPQPVESWQGERQATEFGPRCMQRPLFDDMVFRASKMSEDCLYLNVWTPAQSNNEKLPVLVYIYGGGFASGDGSEPRYDGASMAQQGIVTVTFNYRLGIFGQFSHPELSQESPYKASGNYTLLDQHAALKWVRENIAAFGGDPARVTIAGESAGSFSVSAQMASPLSRDLIAGAIGESGAMMGQLMPLEVAEQNGVKFAETLGAKSLAELRAVPAEQLLEATATWVMPPVVLDGYFFAKSPAEIYAAGEQAKVPLLAGTNSLESWFGALLQNREPTVENYKQALAAIYGEDASRVEALYPAATPEQVMESATELASDLFLSHATWKWVDLHGRTSGKPAFYYYYAHPRPAQRANPQAPVPNGAVHSAEIEYAMGNLDLNDVYAWTEDDRKVSRLLQGYFVNFIKTGNPNGEGLPQWSAYHSDETFPRLTIAAETQLAPDVRRARYQLLEELEAKRSQRQ
jgi:para-nitrobenzyl esterase